MFKECSILEMLNLKLQNGARVSSHQTSVRFGFQTKNAKMSSIIHNNSLHKTFNLRHSFQQNYQTILNHLFSVVHILLLLLTHTPMQTEFKFLEQPQTISSKMNSHDDLIEAEKDN
ncbi:hypothetical protein M758_4G081900 [Ceratodon purpureus]|nr:hypothetical protein M758_4G081900 [Ceratodon purpureus]